MQSDDWIDDVFKDLACVLRNKGYLDESELVDDIVVRLAMHRTERGLPEEPDRLGADASDFCDIP